MGICLLCVSLSCSACVYMWYSPIKMYSCLIFIISERNFETMQAIHMETENQHLYDSFRITFSLSLSVCLFLGFFLSLAHSQSLLTHNWNTDYHFHKLWIECDADLVHFCSSFWSIADAKHILRSNCMRFLWQPMPETYFELVVF